MKIVILDGHTLNPGDLSWDEIRKLGECTVYDRTQPEKILERASKAAAIFTNKVVIGRDIIKQLPDLKFIGVLATGYNVVDLQVAAEADILVANIPAYSTASVAQMVFSHILNIAQNVSKHTKPVKDGDWTNSIDFTYHLTRKLNLPARHWALSGLDKSDRQLPE